MRKMIYALAFSSSLFAGFAQAAILLALLAAHQLQLPPQIQFGSGTPFEGTTT